MNTEPANDLLCDADALTQLVNDAISEMGELHTQEALMLAERLRTALARHKRSSPAGQLVLSEILERGHDELRGVLDSLTQSRHLLQTAAVAKIHLTKAKLREVSSATETAATDVLNGLERAAALVDELDGFAAESATPDERAANTRNALRDELFALMGHMQFQDIASQQLEHAASVLLETESRLVSIARVFDPKTFGTQEMMAIAEATGPATFDPQATTRNAAQRQAVADDVLLHGAR